MTIFKERKLLRPWKQKIFYHLLVWALFISYELLCILATVGLAGRYFHYVIYYILYISLFYVNAHVVLDFSFFRTRRPYPVAVALILAEIMLFGLLKAIIDRALLGGHGPWWNTGLTDRAYMLSNLFRLIFFTGFSIAYWALLNLTRFRDRAMQLEIEELRQRTLNLELTNEYITVENAYLQNQLSPHILFNSLNFIYYAVYRLSARAGRGIMLLSDLLRYSLTAGSSKDTLVGLELELRQIHGLIELDSMRFKDKRYLSFTQKGRTKDLVILPLALLTMVENIIKHGECGDPDHPATAALEVTGNKMTFRTVNKKRLTIHPSTGIGLQNLRKRLNNTYPGKFDFSVREDHHDFFADLTIYL